VLLGEPCNQSLFVGRKRLVANEMHRRWIAAQDAKSGHQAIREQRLSNLDPQAGGEQGIDADNGDRRGHVARDGIGAG
jgi:hypothetical protein